jgi:hypothetical protein
MEGWKSGCEIWFWVLKCILVIREHCICVPYGKCCVSMHSTHFRCTVWIMFWFSAEYTFLKYWLDRVLIQCTVHFLDVRLDIVLIQYTVHNSDVRLDTVLIQCKKHISDVSLDIVLIQGTVHISDVRLDIVLIQCTVHITEVPTR